MSNASTLQGRPRNSGKLVKQRKSRGQGRRILVGPTRNGMALSDLEMVAIDGRIWIEREAGVAVPVRAKPCGEPLIEFLLGSACCSRQLIQECLEQFVGLVQAMDLGLNAPQA